MHSGKIKKSSALTLTLIFLWSHFLLSLLLTFLFLSCSLTFSHRPYTLSFSLFLSLSFSLSLLFIAGKSVQSGQDLSSTILDKTSFLFLRRICWFEAGRRSINPLEGNLASEKKIRSQRKWGVIEQKKNRFQMIYCNFGIKVILITNYNNYKVICWSKAAIYCRGKLQCWQVSYYSCSEGRLVITTLESKL